MAVPIRLWTCSRSQVPEAPSRVTRLGKLANNENAHSKIPVQQGPAALCVSGLGACAHLLTRQLWEASADPLMSLITTRPGQEQEQEQEQEQGRERSSDCIGQIIADEIGQRTATREQHEADRAESRGVGETISGEGLEEQICAALPMHTREAFGVERKTQGSTTKTTRHGTAAILLLMMKARGIAAMAARRQKGGANRAERGGVGRSGAEQGGAKLEAGGRMEEAGGTRQAFPQAGPAAWIGSEQPGGDEPKEVGSVRRAESRGLSKTRPPELSPTIQALRMRHTRMLMNRPQSSHPPLSEMLARPRGQ
jgi:hypothetical protein